MNRLLVIIVLTIALTGCGNSSDEAGTSPADPATTAPAAAQNPQCDDVWIAGNTLPPDYDGCIRPDGNIEAPVVYTCDSGIGDFTGYDDAYYALLGDTIAAIDGDDDPAYSTFYDDCFTEPN